MTKRKMGLVEYAESTNDESEIEGVKEVHFWYDFFKNNYENLPHDLYHILADYFKLNVGDDFEVNAEFDNRFQRIVIKLVIEYCKKLATDSEKSWHEYYSEYIVNFANKSIGVIYKNNLENRE